mmetsp:Transcript_17059/g.29180  ORF Transcript_17059/g.29180 Transcript_17059/m.29180 type:complete len:91 (+) Transcript_17059:620-892(+)
MQWIMMLAVSQSQHHMISFIPDRAFPQLRTSAAGHCHSGLKHSSLLVLNSRRCRVRMPLTSMLADAKNVTMFIAMGRAVCIKASRLGRPM